MLDKLDSPPVRVTQLEIGRTKSYCEHEPNGVTDYCEICVVTAFGLPKFIVAAIGKDIHLNNVE